MSVLVLQARVPTLSATSGT